MEHQATEPTRIRPGVAVGVPLEDVSFCQASARSARAVGDEGSARFTLWAASAVVAGAALVGAGAWLARIAGVASIHMLLGAGLLACLVIPVVAIVAAGRRTQRGRMAVPRLGDPALRIHVCCSPDALLALGPIEDVDFEPEIVRVLLVSPRGVRDGLIYVGGALAAIPVAAAAGRVMGVGIPPFFAMQAGFLAGMVAIASIRQTYLRIAPGRLDVMEFTAWRPVADSCRTFDLRTGRLAIEPRRRRIVVGASDREPTVKAPATVVSFVGAVGGWRVAHTLLRASVSTASSPDLPRDRLHD